MMYYKSFINEFELPDQNLGLYFVENFTFDVQKPGKAVGRSPARMTRNESPRYQGEDVTAPEPAFTSYFGFDRARPTHTHHQP